MVLAMLVGVLALGVAGYLVLPALARAAGLHPDYAGPVHRMPARSRALIVTTSHAELGDTGRKTGVFSSALTAPYYAFLDAGMQVDIASIEGGRVPFDPVSFLWFIIARSDKRAKRDATFIRGARRRDHDGDRRRRPAAARRRLTRASRL